MFNFLSKQPIKTESFEILNLDKTLHSNYLFYYDTQNTGSKLSENQYSVFKSVYRGRMIHQVDWSDLQRTFYLVESLGNLSRKLKKVLKVLDLGCGRSEILLSSYRHYLKLEYHGVDLKILRLKQTLQNVHTLIPYYLYCHNLNKKLPFVNEYFDVLLSFDIIEHMPTKIEGFKFFKRSLTYLKKGGTVVLTTPNCELNGKKAYPAAHDYEYTRTELLKFFKSLSNIKIEKEYGADLSHKMYEKLKPADPFVEKIFNDYLGSSMSKLSIISSFYPEHSRKLLYILKKI